MASSYSAKGGFKRDADGTKAKLAAAEKKLADAKQAAKPAKAPAAKKA